MARSSFPLICLALVLVAFPNAASAALVAYYSFEDQFESPFDPTVVKDRSGNNLHGNVNSYGDPVWTTGAPLGPTPPGGMSLDASMPPDNDGGDYIIVGHDPLLNITHSLTVSAWIKATMTPQHATGGGWDAIVVKGQDATWGLQQYGWSPYAHFYVVIGGAVQEVGGDIPVFANPYDADPNNDVPAWHHVMGVYDYDNSLLMLYVDGVLDASKSVAGSIDTSTFNVTIGEISDIAGGPMEPLLAAIDEVRIYNHAVPEPAALTLLAFGGLAALAKRRK